MKINKIGPINVNPYKKQMEKSEKAQSLQKKDNIQISTEALALQKGSPFEIERSQRVEELKNQVESGEYEVNPKEVARKMYSFWNNE